MRALRAALEAHSFLLEQSTCLHHDPTILDVAICLDVCIEPSANSFEEVVHPLVDVSRRNPRCLSHSLDVCEHCLKVRGFEFVLSFHFVIFRFEVKKKKSRRLAGEDCVDFASAPSTSSLKLVSSSSEVFAKLLRNVLQERRVFYSSGSFGRLNVGSN